MNGNGKKREAIGLLGGFLIIAVVLLCLRSCSLQKENEELKLLNRINQDQKELNCLYESGDFTDETWLMNYREIGLRFLNYLCEYGGEKEEVKQLIELYQKYGEKILGLSDLIQEGKIEEAKKELEEVKEVAEEIESSLEAAYEQAH